MIVYKYHPETFEYIDEVEADVNPFHKDQYIYPAYTTKEKPLENKEGYVNVWAGNKWQYVEDHRGETWFNVKTKEQEVITFIGEITNSYATLDSDIANPPEETYYEYDAKLKKWVGNLCLLKQYINTNIDKYFKLKQEEPYIFENHSYLPKWRDSYTTIYTALSNKLMDNYTIKDNDGVEFNVDKNSMKPIYTKILNVNDEMYKDKFILIKKVSGVRNFDLLLKFYNEWLSKKY